MAVPNYIDIVRAVKQELIDQGIDVDASEASRAEITFRVADRLHWRIDPTVGLLYKPTGNNVRERAVDILCFRDGTIVDVLGHGPDGPNTPLWLVNVGKVDPERWRAPFLYHDVTPPVPPSDPPPLPMPEVPPTAVPAPPVAVPVPVPEPPAPVVPSGLAQALSALGAWLGTAAVNALLGWFQNRKKATSTPTGNAGPAIARAIPPSRSTLPK